ncbi:MULTISPECIES: pyridoxamine 5'-phosphate oxidase family protein [unclassified Streptomyces]|uniref:pyridoxamine 5'-phosphate oxidase family protein n=1 Tax=unclassified Streptomyces TaxID=2593676 RepID=UPI00036E9C1B|nr:MULTISPECIES: pyridoxamine 5'-phosphate oxidase family protein [unclassified Streptomyces]MYT32493.1 pyridoxamine 5'-phosphate oxidase family protein [Streptomyces sp. SID8354]
MSPSEATSPAARHAPAGRPGLPAPRPIAQRRADTERLLAQERHLWLASKGPRPHMVPLSYVFDGGVITMLTRRSGRTARNLAANGLVRAAFGAATDVVLIDGTVKLTDPADAPPEVRARHARLPLDPDRVEDAVSVCLTPRRVQAWRNFGEMPDRVIMHDGVWLV